MTSLTLLIDLNTAFAVIGCLAALSAVLLILISRAYLQYVHRLQLYLAIVSFVFAGALGFEAMPITVGANDTVTVSNDSWGDACVAIGYIAQHFGLSKAFCTLWICIYVYVVAVYQKQLRQFKYEIGGLVIIFALPGLMAWMPFLHGSYGVDGIWCWIKVTSDDVTIAFQLGIAHGFVTLLHVISIILVFASVVKFCKGFFVTDGALQSPYRVALNEVLPLTIYPFIYSILSILSGTKSIIDVVMNGSDERDAYTSEIVVIGLLQTFILSLPLSLLLNSRMRHSVSLRVSFRRRICVNDDGPYSHTELSQSTSKTASRDDKEPLVSSRSCRATGVGTGYRSGDCVTARLN